VDEIDDMVRVLCICLFFIFSFGYINQGYFGGVGLKMGYPGFWRGIEDLGRNPDFRLLESMYLVYESGSYSP
jgi:hypothetical protein